MDDRVEVTPHGEIVMYGADGEAMAYQDGGSWVVRCDTYARWETVSAEVRLTRDGLAAWCRRVLREIES